MQTLTADRKVVVRRVYVDKTVYGHNRKRWYREAVKAIAEDMLSCRAVIVSQDYQLDFDRTILTYAFQEFRKERYLP